MQYVEIRDVVRFTASDISLHYMDHVSGFNIAQDKGSECCSLDLWIESLYISPINQLILQDANHEILFGP
jgi:hypothetical protein